MVSFLEYNPMFHPAIMQVFGKTLICRSLDLCSHFARTANLDCITPEGNITIYIVWASIRHSGFTVVSVLIFDRYLS